MWSHFGLVESLMGSSDHNDCQTGENPDYNRISAHLPRPFPVAWKYVDSRYSNSFANLITSSKSLVE